MSAPALRQQPVWMAPMLPVALALTAGILLERVCVVPLSVSFALALTSSLAAVVFSFSSQRWLPIIYLWCVGAAVGAAWHHWRCHYLSSDDISHFAYADPQPTRLRGTLDSAPITQPSQAGSLRSFPSKERTRFVLRVTQQQDLATRSWSEVAGLVQVTLVGHQPDITVGDEVELLGRLALPESALNAGEFDYAAFLRDQGITATLTVLEADEVVLVQRGSWLSFFGWLAMLHGWGQDTLNQHLSGQREIAAALLLGEGSGMSSEAWEQYLRSGVIHVLAISGQHLVVLAGFLWLLMRTLHIRRRRAAIFIALVLLAYALLTGGRPAVMRSAVLIAVFAFGTLLRRPVSHANSFAIAWIGVALLNPADLFSAGCQLSFLAVAVLVWGVRYWAAEPSEALDHLIDESRPWHLATALWLWRWLRTHYAINAAVSLAVAPLVAAHFHVVSPVAFLIGPPMVFLTSLALLTGFAVLLFAPWCAPLAGLFGLATQWSLNGCEFLVSLGLRLPGAYFFVGNVPAWWLWIFYVGLLVGLTLPIVWQHGRWALLAAGVWLALGVLLELQPHRPGEFRCSFVAVGHGGCTVVESDSGHVTVYDAGATTGPDVTRRSIAPFLWSRGIRRIDDLILSHADLDHFNGVKDLAERFAIGRAICTPSFAERNMPAIRETLAALKRHRIPVHVVHAGQRWHIDGTSFTVLHPPAAGPPGKENVRSLVLHIKYRDWSMLLTGDLEEAGLTRVLNLPRIPIDLLMAPHHGSDRSNIPALADWAKPKLVASCQTAPLNERAGVKMYEKLGIPYLGTWPHGTVTLRHDGGRAWVETYRSKRVFGPYHP